MCLLQQQKTDKYCNWYQEWGFALTKTLKYVALLQALRKS